MWPYFQVSRHHSVIIWPPRHHKIKLQKKASFIFSEDGRLGYLLVWHPYSLIVRRNNYWMIVQIPIREPLFFFWANLVSLVPNISKRAMYCRGKTSYFLVQLDKFGEIAMQMHFTISNLSNWATLVLHYPSLSLSIIHDGSCEKNIYRDTIFAKTIWGSLIGFSQSNYL